MFKKMMKFTAIRLVAIPLGFVLYIYTMIKDPGSMRTAQKFARSLSDWIEALLPDQVVRGDEEGGEGVPHQSCEADPSPQRGEVDDEALHGEEKRRDEEVLPLRRLSSQGWEDVRHFLVKDPKQEHK